MEEMIRSWLYALLVSGCICSLVLFLNTDGKTKMLMETGCACVMVLTFISPFNGFYTGTDISQYFSQWSVLEQQSTQLTDYEKYVKQYIESEYSAYIRKEAEAFSDTPVDAAVSTIKDENGNWIPFTVHYSANEPISEAFKSHIEKTMGIAKERQH